MKKRIFYSTAALIIILWGTWIGVIIRQKQMLETAPAMSDTGVAFGYSFLVRIALPALIALTLIAVVTLYRFRNSGRK